MVDRGWAYQDCDEFHAAKTMHDRAEKLLEGGVDVVIGLAGGIGTLEEIMEMINWKQLGLIDVPICLVNSFEFYTHLLKFVEHMAAENFISVDPSTMFSVVDTPEQAMEFLDSLGADAEEQE